MRKLTLFRSVMMSVVVCGWSLIAVPSLASTLGQENTLSPGPNFHFDEPIKQTQYYPYGQQYNPVPQYSPAPQQYQPVPQLEFVSCVHSEDECHHMAEHQGHHVWRTYYSPQYCHHHPHLACYGAHDHHH